MKDPLIEILERANPNPDRAGCPPDGLIRSMARGERDLADLAFGHLTTCFPCYQAFGTYRQQFLRAKRNRWLAVAAAVAITTLASVLLMSRPARVDHATLDLRPFSVVRSEAPATPTPVAITRNRLSTTIYLPVGSEPGPYELQIVTADFVSRFATVVTAQLRDGLTIIATEIDASALTPGRYQMALRHTGQDWRFYPIEVR